MNINYWNRALYQTAIDYRVCVMVTSQNDTANARNFNAETKCSFSLFVV